MDGYFTEKIIDLLLLKVVPVYWGCSNIQDFFDVNGILQFKSVDQCIRIINHLTNQTYNSMLESIQNNYNTSLQYKNVYTNIKNVLYKIFNYNNLI